MITNNIPIGSGKYSKVYLGHDKQKDEEVVIKVLNHARMDKIKREIKIMSAVSGGTNIVDLLDVVKDPSGNTTYNALIMPKVNAVPFKAAA